MHKLERVNYLVISISLGLLIVGFLSWLLTHDSAAAVSAQVVEQNEVLLSSDCAATLDEGATVYTDLQGAVDDAFVFHGCDPSISGMLQRASEQVCWPLAGQSVHFSPSEAANQVGSGSMRPSQT